MKGSSEFSYTSSFFFFFFSAKCGRHKDRHAYWLIAKAEKNKAFRKREKYRTKKNVKILVERERRGKLPMTKD